MCGKWDALAFFVLNFLIPLFLLGTGLVVHGAEFVGLRAALVSQDLRCEFTSIPPDCVMLKVGNQGGLPVSIEIPAGVICAGADGTARMIVLHRATLAVPSGSTGEALLPAVLLSSTLPTPGKLLRILDDGEKQLDPLLKWLAERPDVPRATAQLATFCLLENMTFFAWQKYLAERRSSQSKAEAHPTPAEIAQAIDVIGLLKEVAPERAFALASDGELKLRALRNPWCRAKAMKLYGINATDDGSEFGLPDIGQLLHSKPGDNCPVCRSRAEMQKGASDF